MNLDLVPLLFEDSRPGRRCVRHANADKTQASHGLPARELREAPPALPEMGELDLIRHFTRLSQKNFAISTQFYPLGSCTMKYNPRINERLAGLPGFAQAHPLQPEALLPFFLLSRLPDRRGPIQARPPGPFARSGRRHLLPPRPWCSQSAPGTLPALRDC